MTRVPDRGARLAELLSSIAEAGDFAAAAALLTARFASAAGATRACMVALGTELRTLDAVAWVGFEDGERPAPSVGLDEVEHPLVVCALSLGPVICDGNGPTPPALPFTRWVAIPVPQPLFRGAPSLLSAERAAKLTANGCATQRPMAAEGLRRIGQAPCGVVVIEALPDAELTAELAHVATLAGPVLSRMLVADEYRRAAERIDHQRNLLDTIIHSLPDPIVISDSTNAVATQNRRAERLLVVSESDSEGRRRAVEINNLLLAGFLAKGGVPAARAPRELNLVDPEDGSDLLFEVFSRGLNDVAAPGASVSVLRDVTDLRRAAAELERQVRRARFAEQNASRERDRLNLILENVADPILVTDDRSNIILMNRQAEQLFEVGDRATERAAAIARTNDATFTAFIADFSVSPEPSRREQMRLARPDGGEQLPVEVVSGKILNERGEPLAVVSVLHDLTKQVENEGLYDELKQFSGQLEQRIREATADLEAQNARLQWQAHELEKASRLKSDFLANMSHELRTPINALIGYTALMLDRIYGDINPRQEEGLHRIRASAQHLLALINDILDLAKIEAGKMPLHLEGVSLGEVIGEISQQMEPLVRRKGLEFVCDVPAAGVSMYTDRTKVKQILLNLVSNAEKFTSSGRVTVRAARDGDGVRIEVSDTGIGIRAEDLAAIWEDFRQVDQSRTREFGGTGLGLSITRKLVDALGGAIDVRSTYGQGATFTVVLPLRTTDGGDGRGAALPDATGSSP